MLTPEELLVVARRKWPSVLRSEAKGISLFPLHIPFGRPSTTEDFDTVRREIEPLVRASHGWEIEWESINTRKWGLQRWPARILFRTVEDMAASLHLIEDLCCFREALAFARNTCPALEPWLTARGHKIPDLFTDWPRLVEICSYFHENPRPLCFPRQLAISADTKFVKERAGILREMLDVVLGEQINADGSTFEERFHLLTEPPQIRFRFLDPIHRSRNGWPVMDCAVPRPEFAGLKLDVPRVLIVENKVVFLCLPYVPDTIAILGNGKAAALLSNCPWIKDADIVYWGDCDQAGYGILSLLRERFGTTRSVLMDSATWSRWKALAVPGKADPSAHSVNLTPDERSVLDVVRQGPWMLEQERIPQCESDHAIIEAFGLSSTLGNTK